MIKLYEVTIIHFEDNIYQIIVDNIEWKTCRTTNEVFQSLETLGGIVNFKYKNFYN